VSDTIIVTLELSLKPEVVEGFCQQIPATLEGTRTFPGFVSIAIRRNADDPNRVIFIEEWDTRAAYDAYVAFRTKQGMMDQMAAMLTAPPETRFWDAKVA